MMVKLFIAGHGLRPDGSFDPGALGLIKKGEHKYMVEDLFPAMKKHLPKNHDVVFYTAKDVYSTNNLVSLVKKYNANEVIEFHYDAASATATGGHVIIYSGYKPDKLDLAIRDVIKDMVGTIYTHKGESGINGRDNLANVNRAANAGISYRLVELGFGTNKKDADVLVNKTDEYAKKLVKVIVGKTSNKPTTNTSSKPKKQSKPKPKPKNYYQKGDSGAQVKTIQNNLIKHGYSVGRYGADGVYGNDTDKAVRAFQKAKGLKVDGVAGVKTIAALKKKPSKKKVKYPLPNKVLRYGSRGNDVKQLQRALNAANFKVGEVDGIYGTKTQNAVERFQMVYDAYEVDGIYGARTRTRLNKKVN